MKSVSILAATTVVFLASTNGEIVINDFLSSEGFIDADTKADKLDWDALFISRALPIEAPTSTIYFQLNLNRQEIFGYYRNEKKEMSVIPPNNLYYVTTSRKDGELDSIEIREKENADLVYRIKVDGRKLTVVLAPKGYVDPIRFMDITWAPWSPYKNREVDTTESKKD
ncbi:hypothetical protein [Coraliomargarita parva]|uniref:hypothetical protein n=1 Tax=Coraliomargarita parva TaxID=3014050 RepID=UPI0022B3C9AF|nr:hypothetical protein [Coraliomargarita parva]